MRNAWSATMSLVIWLDAPDSMLLERIRSRDRAHPCKEMSDGDASAWLGRYRAGFESSLAVLQLSRPADLVRIDTSRQRPDEIAASLVDLIETHPHILSRYMGKAPLEAYRAYWHARDTDDTTPEPDAHAAT